MSNVDKLLDRSEESLKIIRVLNEIASNPVLNSRSKHVVTSQMYTAIHEYAKGVLDILEDPLFGIETRDSPVDTTTTTEEDDTPKKGSQIKAKIAASKLLK